MPNLSAGQLVLAGGTVLDLARFELRAGDQTHYLTMIEWRFLATLARWKDKVVTWERLHEAIYEQPALYRPEAGKLLRKIASRLRKAIGAALDAALVTIWGVGFRLVPNVGEAVAPCETCRPATMVA